MMRTRTTRIASAPGSTGMGSLFILLVCLAVSTATSTARAQYLSNLEARADDPLFATYAAPTDRSRFAIDQGYHFRYYDDAEAIAFTTAAAGVLGTAFHADGRVRLRPADMAEPPVVTASYNDLVRYRLRPFDDLVVEGHFQVYSSQLALHELRVTNSGSSPLTLDVTPYIAHEYEGPRQSDDRRAVHFEHEEQPDSWTIRQGVPFMARRQSVFLVDEVPVAFGHAGPAGREANATETGQRGVVDAESSAVLRRLFDVLRDESLVADSAGMLAFHHRMVLDPGATKRLRIVRGVDDAASAPADLRAAAEGLLDDHAQSDAESSVEFGVEFGLREAERRYARIPELAFDDPLHEAAYWNAFSLMEQVMLPPEGESSYNYYVFSREPTWGWGHGGQVFHESLTMLAYVYMNPEGAMDSQRVYMERQHDDGYINYRTGSYLNETITTDGERTSSAPWFNWINWELFRVAGDRAFLEEAYASGTAFYEWWMASRDRDGDGLVEWGGHAVLESVRDSEVAVWDEVGWPDRFEALDLNSMLVAEARSLASMAGALGDTAGAARWTQEAEGRARRIRTLFWDDETGFFYHIDRDDHDFSVEADGDLKRKEIIGFLPLWAGVSNEEQTERLVEHLTDPSTFWRPYGIPSLAADDPYYDPMGYWNGPVWVEWQYLIFRGLLDQGYRDVAVSLADRVIANVAHHLGTDHTFWELYSPDDLQAGHHQTYIWTGLVARMMIDLR